MAPELGRATIAAAVAAAAATGALVVLWRRLSKREAELPAQLRHQSTKGAFNTTGSRGALQPSNSFTKSKAKKWAAFISHYKAEAAAEARLIQIELEAHLDRPAFLDSDDLRDLRELQAHVRNSSVLVLVRPPKCSSARGVSSRS
jgi:hypothetical protein